MVVATLLSKHCYVSHKQVIVYFNFAFAQIFWIKMLLSIISVRYSTEMVNTLIYANTTHLFGVFVCSLVDL